MWHIHIFVCLFDDIEFYGLLKEYLRFQLILSLVFISRSEIQFKGYLVFWTVCHFRRSLSFFYGIFNIGTFMMKVLSSFNKVDEPAR